MKNSFIILSFSFLCFNFSYSSIKDSLSISDDAKILALRLQQTGIFLDSALAKEVDDALTRAREIKDTLKTIHAFPDYIMNQLILMSSGSWTTAWKNSELHTGNKFIDSLSDVYFLDTVEVHGIGSSVFFVLTYKLPLHIKNLAKIYMQDPSVFVAEPNGIVGDGNNIEVIKKNGIWNLAFSLGIGDCPAGCMFRYYWYISVEGTSATFLEEKGTDYTKPIIYRWNIPARYDPTYFVSLSSILENARNATEWWVRQYAIESLGKLYTQKDWYLRNEQFQILKNEAIQNKKKCVSMLTELINDPDPDILNSAILNLGALIGNGRNYSAYFPLSVGNRWIWSKSFRGDSIEIITDTVIYDEKKYFRFNRLRELDTPMVRMDDQNYLRVNALSTAFVPWLNFNLNVGDIYKIQFFSTPLLEWEVQIGSKNDTVVIGTMIFMHCWRFDAITCCDWGWTEWFAPGIGPVKREQTTLHGIETYYLVSAQVDSTEIVTTLEEKKLNTPFRFSLEQNYPNPFNPTTNFRFSILQSSIVKLQIYDVLGRKVVTVVNEQKPPGTYDVQWNAANISSGIYFYRLQAGPFTMIKKLVLLR